MLTIKNTPLDWLQNFILRGNNSYLDFVRMKGLEPPRLSAPDPKSGAATNYATSALFFGSANIQQIILTDPYKCNFFCIRTVRKAMKM